MTETNHDATGKRSPIVTGPDGTPWYGVADDSERWQRFVANHPRPSSSKKKGAYRMRCRT